MAAKANQQTAYEAEVKRKALNNIPLANKTAQSDALYKTFQAATAPKPAATAIAPKPTTLPAATSPTMKPAPVQYSAPAAPAPVASGRDPLNEIEYLKKQWENGTKGQQTWASQQANQYYSTLDPAEAAKVRGMNAKQLAEYRAGKVAPVTAPQVDGIQQLGSAVVNGINQSPATYQDSQGTIRDTIADQATNNTPSNNLMDLFKEAIETAGDPNSDYWDIFRDLADQQAKGEVEGKQQQLDAARSGLDDKYFQEYLQNRQGMANRGLGNSGMANESNFRLQLAKQGQLADMFTKLGTFDQDSIAADKFKEMYSENNDTMLKKANALQGMYGQASQYDKISTQDLLKQLFSYDQLKTQDNWNDVESLLGLRNQDIQQGQFKEQSKQFYDKLGQDRQVEAAKIGFDYDKLTTEKKQFYDKLNQDGAIESAKLDMELRRYGLDVAKVMGVDEKGNPTLDMQKLQADTALAKASLSEQFRHNRASESLQANGQAISVARLNETIRKNDDMAKKYALEMQMAGKKDQSNMLYDQVSGLGKQLDRLGKLIDSKDVSKEQKAKYTAEYEKYAKQYDTTLNGMAVISKGYK